MTVQQWLWDQVDDSFPHEVPCESPFYLCWGKKIGVERNNKHISTRVNTTQLTHYCRHMRFYFFFLITRQLGRSFGFWFDQEFRKAPWNIWKNISS